MTKTINEAAAAMIDNKLCVIVDIDGTIADTTHRNHHMEKKPKDYAAFEAAMHLDRPITEMVSLLKILRPHYAVILATCRAEKDRDVTVRWLRDHDVWYDMLFMAATNDSRPNPEIKQDMLAEIRHVGFVPQFAIEDRKSVVQMWRKAGLICLQCADGDF